MKILIFLRSYFSSANILKTNNISIYIIHFVFFTPTCTKKIRRVTKRWGSTNSKWEWRPPVSRMHRWWISYLLQRDHSLVMRTFFLQVLEDGVLGCKLKRWFKVELLFFNMQRLLVISLILWKLSFFFFDLFEGSLLAARLFLLFLCSILTKHLLHSQLLS